MNTTKKNWGCFLKEYFAFWKANWCGLTPLLMACPTAHTCVNLRTERSPAVYEYLNSRNIAITLIDRVQTC